MHDHLKDSGWMPLPTKLWTHQRVTEVAPPTRRAPQLVAIPHDAEPDGDPAHPQEKHPIEIHLHHDKTIAKQCRPFNRSPVDARDRVAEFALVVVLDRFRVDVVHHVVQDVLPPHVICKEMFQNPALMI